MAYQDNDSKFAVIINKKATVSATFNAVAHACLGLMTASEEQKLLNYPHDETGIGAVISKYPVIVFEARNANQIRTFVKAAVEVPIPVNYFTTQMIAQTAEAQITANQTTPWDALDFVCAVAFGQRELVDPLTRKFSLLK